MLRLALKSTSLPKPIELIGIWHKKIRYTELWQNLYYL